MARSPRVKAAGKIVDLDCAARGRRVKKSRPEQLFTAVNGDVDLGRLVLGVKSKFAARRILARFALYEKDSNASGQVEDSSRREILTRVSHETRSNGIEF